MKYVYAIIGILIVFLFVVGAGCTQSVCPQGQTMIGDSCCYDKDMNSKCDSSETAPKETPAQKPSETEGEPIAEDETPTTGYVWDDAKVSVEGYTCINKSIAINFKNNLPNSISVEKVRLGSGYAKGLPTFIKSKEIKNIEISNALLEKGKPIDQSLFVGYKDWVKKETKYIGPAKLEGIC